MNIYYIDLFAGAGGTSTGIHLASENTKVLVFFTLENYIELSKDNARLNRIIEMKHKKQLNLQDQVNELQSKLDKIQELINTSN